MKNNKELTFNLERASSYLKISKEFIAEIKMDQSKLDIIYQQLTIKIDALFYSSLAGEQILTYYCPRPKFLDWLLRRERKIEWKIIAKDLLINPSRHPDLTKRIYINELQ